MTSTEKEFSTTKELVEHLLATDERCRNDDKWLTYRVMDHHTNIFIPFQDFKKLPAFETPKRVRAQIQNKEGRYLPTDPEVLRRRGHREEEVKQWVRDQ